MATVRFYIAIRIPEQKDYKLRDLVQNRIVKLYL